MKTGIICRCLLFVTLFALSIQLNAQIDIEGKIKSKTNDRANQRTDNGIDKGLDAIEGGVKDIFTKKDKKTQNENADETPTDVENDEKKDDANPDEKQKQPELASYSKYDFIAGEKVVFFDDFTQDAIGDFPALWNTDASGEVVSMNNYPGRWLKMGPNASLIPGTDGTFPENYTIEFDLVPINSCDFGCYIYEAENPASFNEGGAIPGKSGIKIWFGNYQHSYSTYDEGSYVADGNSEKAVLVPSQKSRISIWVQKQRIRVYINETKVFDVPKALRANAKNNVVRFLSSNDNEPYITNVRLAVGQPDMRSKLITEGKLVSYGIYFDVNSDKVKPESYGTLKEISKVLTENPDVKIKIFGHTDGDGDAASNLDLSRRRAASVKNELSKNFGIEASRIETDGKGESEPVAPNDTPANKAQNRRVEFIKL